MPWKERYIVTLREEFVLKAKAKGANIAALCREFGISRKNGYKWIERYDAGGVEALQDMSRRPRRVIATAGEVVLRILELRHRHPGYGPKKLRALLIRQGDAKDKAPTVRTIVRILDRAGEPLIRPRRKRKELLGAVNQAPSVEATAPNAVWTVDFKGWWRTGDGLRCEPLTVRDACSRFVLCAKRLNSTKGERVRKEFERLFEAYGLPATIQVDNGSPFASTRARCGLTRLSAWWVSLGIRVIRSRRGCPQDNGGHERMHGEIALDIEVRPAGDGEAEQLRLDRWREEFNTVRPHEALAMKTPAEIYQRSTRRYRGPLRPCYPFGTELRRVDHSGHAKLDGHTFFLAGGLARQDVGFERRSDEHLRVRFYHLILGDFVLIEGKWTECVEKVEAA